MKLLLLLALAAIGQCALLGSKKCTYGPSYWCSHIHHAKECGAMQHCMTTVWKNEKLGMAGGVVTCFDTIKVLDVVRHSSESDLLEQMAIGCTGLPQEKRSVCKELMMHDQNEVHMLLKSDLPSHHVAAALGLCGSFSDNVPHHLETVQSQVQVSSDYCKDCVNFFNDLRQIFNNSEGQLEDLIKNAVCPNLGPLESLCDQLIEQYVGVFLNMVYEQIDAERICHQLQLCENQKHAMLMKSMKNIMDKALKGSEECSICKEVAKELQDELRDPAMQKELLDLMENDVCSVLPGDLANQCKTYVAQYGPVVFEILVAELDPDTFCETVGLCKAAQIASNVMGTVQILPETKNEVAGPECALCELVMTQLKSMLNNKATKAEIEEALEQVCTLLPSSLKTECDQFVKQYGPLIVDLLDRLNPEQVCTALGLCSSKQAHQPLKVTEPVKSAETCSVCKMVMGYIENEVSQPINEKKVEQILGEVCNQLPGSFKQECQSLISQYYPAIVNLLLQSFQPSKICTELSLCSSSNPLLFRPMAELQPAKPHLP